MRAAQITQYGPREVIEVNDVPVPVPGKGQVLVKVFASSINPFDVKLRQGLYRGMIPLHFPVTLGSDVAGVVHQVGEGVEGFLEGNQVFGSTGPTGGFAEYALVPADQLAPKPHNLNFNQAASVVLAGASAIQALQDHMKLKKGQHVLIHGGAGGIGSLAIQLAKAQGVKVSATATGDGLAFVTRLGADTVIDYRHQPFEESGPVYDAVFDTVGGDTYERSFKVLKQGGVLVSMLEPANEVLARQYRVTAIMQLTKVNTDRLKRLAEFIEQDKITPQVEKIYPLEHIKDAFEDKEEEEVRGKVVISII